MPASNPVIRSLRQNKTFAHRGLTYPISHSTPLSVCETYFELIRANGYRNVLEIGTLYGQSTLFLAEAVSALNGHVTTVDLRLPERVWSDKQKIVNIHEVAERFVNEAGFSDIVTFRPGDSNEVLPQLARERKTFDFILIDGSHEYPVALLDFLNSDRLLTRGGTIALDDVGPRTARNEKLNGGPNRLLPMIFSSGRYEIDMVNANVALCRKVV